MRLIESMNDILTDEERIKYVKNGELNLDKNDPQFSLILRRWLETFRQKVKNSATEDREKYPEAFGD